mmetsp:Transcript_54270/g.151455  ORF Transcript_54270/g.151455 Transcript_54270/m.151455 type:complete len:321 (+) Transcript_54270:538-1500(+)
MVAGAPERLVAPPRVDAPGSQRALDDRHDVQWRGDHVRLLAAPDGKLIALAEVLVKAQHAVLRYPDGEHVERKVAHVEHQRRRGADHHEDGQGKPEEGAQGRPEVGDVLCHDEDADDLRHDAGHGEVDRDENQHAAYHEPRQGDVDHQHVLLLGHLVDHPVDVVPQEDREAVVDRPADLAVWPEHDSRFALGVAEDVVAEVRLGPRAVQQPEVEPEVGQAAPSKEHELPGLVHEELHPEELHSSLGPALHGAEVVRVHLGDAGADGVVHVHAALALAEVLVRGGRVLDLGARLEILEVHGLVSLPTEVDRVDLPHGVGPA